MLCKKDDESLNHLILTCDFSIRIWSKIIQEFGRQWVIPRSATDLLYLGQGLLLNKKGRIIWKVATAATFWAIWLKRNKMIFDGMEDNFLSIWDRIKLWVGIWLHFCKDFKSIHFTLLV